MGSICLSRYAGEEGERCPLDGIAVLGCPVDLPSTSKKTSAALFGIYQYAMSQGLQDKLKSPDHQRLMHLLRDHGYPLDKALATQTHFAMDALIYAPMFGYDNVGDYYRQISPGT